jgi:glutamine amidotransferase
VIALVDYGIGNLLSVEKALESVGATVQVTSDPARILSAERVVLPGVGAFGDGMAELDARGLVPVVQQVAVRQIPLLGICLGMQLLFETGDEHGSHRGLGLLMGSVRRFDLAARPELKIPQTGWNQVFAARETPLLWSIAPGSFAYFNHSFYCAPAELADVLATTEYGGRYASIVGRGRIFGVQFHPEKSQAVGLQLLRNFVERC